MEIQSVPTGSLVPWDKNPRSITEQAFKGLCESIKKFGMPQPIVANKRNNHIVGGHMRWRAAKEVGWATVPVVWLDLNDQDEAALNITLNNRHISGAFTQELDEILHELKAELDPIVYEALQLTPLEVPDHWDTGQDAVDQEKENLDGIKAVIKVTCAHDCKAELTRLIKKLVEDGGYHNVAID